MLGSHNSFTYLKATSSLLGYFPIFWRCQYKTIQEQYADGVRFFDVRVRLEKKAGRNMWRCAHGAVNLSQLFTSIKNIFVFFQNMPGAKFRLLLEDKDGAAEFKAEVEPFIKNPEDCCLFIGIKSGWEVLYNRMIQCVDYTYTPFLSDLSFWENVKNLKISTIKKYASEHNPPINKAMIDDPNVIYFMDYV